MGVFSTLCCVATGQPKETSYGFNSRQSPNNPNGQYSGQNVSVMDSRPKLNQMSYQNGTEIDQNLQSRSTDNLASAPPGYANQFPDLQQPPMYTGIHAAFDNHAYDGYQNQTQKIPLDRFYETLKLLESNASSISIEIQPEFGNFCQKIEGFQNAVIKATEGSSGSIATDLKNKVISLEMFVKARVLMDKLEKDIVFFQYDKAEKRVNDFGIALNTLKKEILSKVSSVEKKVELLNRCGELEKQFIAVNGVEHDSVESFLESRVNGMMTTAENTILILERGQVKGGEFVCRLITEAEENLRLASSYLVDPSIEVANLGGKMEKYEELSQRLDKIKDSDQNQTGITNSGDNTSETDEIQQGSTERAMS